MDNSNITDCEIHDINIQSTDIENCEIKYTEFQGDNEIKRSDIRDSVIKENEMPKMVLTQCEVFNSKLTETDLTNSKINLCTFDSLQIKNIDFKGNIMKNTTVIDSTIIKCNCKRAKWSNIDQTNVATPQQEDILPKGEFTAWYIQDTVIYRVAIPKTADRCLPVTTRKARVSDILIDWECNFQHESSEKEGQRHIDMVNSKIEKEKEAHKTVDEFDGNKLHSEGGGLQIYLTLNEAINYMCKTQDQEKQNQGSILT